MTSLFLLLAAAAPLGDVPAGFRAADGGLVHEASGVACPDALSAGGLAFTRAKANGAGWRASCIYKSIGEDKVSAAFSVEIAPVAGSPVDNAATEKMLDVTALLMTRGAPAEAVTHIAPGVVAVRRAPETGKVERHVATRRGGWMVNYSGVATLAREATLASMLDGFRTEAPDLGRKPEYVSRAD
jgi:hypothetical protein